MSVASFFNLPLGSTISPLFFILFSLLSSSFRAIADDLISARCQSKCLYELELRHRNNSEARRLLRHQISTLCKEDVLCASCILPCRDLVLDEQRCGRTFCLGTPEPNECRQSCAFLVKIGANKPGQCPNGNQQKMPAGLDSECSAFCDSDSDCPEIEKCCSVGCSRTCLGPLLNDSRLLPKPEGISVQERKRKRSAILRWIMKRLTPQHTSTNSNLYVIQWRWSVHKQPETMTPWQTVMVRNKMYAILKHLLAPGRFYLFRVAAVNQHGTYGFSQPSHPPFKLSKEVKAPSSPMNLTVLPNNEPVGFAKIAWSPPDSELPIKEYTLSWWRSSLEMANAFELRQRRSSKGAGPVAVDEDYDGGGAEMAAEIDENGDEKRRLVLPSYSTKAELDGLKAGQIYMVELFATVESSEGELRGEPAILFLKTGGTASRHEDDRNNGKKPSSAPPALTRTKSAMENGAAKQSDFADDDGSHPFVAELKTPFFEGGRLKTILSWLDHAECEEKEEGEKMMRRRKKEKGPHFRVLIRSLHCLNQLPPQQFSVHGCVATLENLQFRCEYYVRVERGDDEEKKKENGKETGEQQKQLIARLTFATLPCEQTPSDVPLQCEGEKEDADQIQSAEAQPLEAASTPQSNARRTTKTTTTKGTTTMRTTTTTRRRGGENNGKMRKNGREEREEEEEEEEWLPIEEVEENRVEEDGGIKKAEKPRERGTRTKKPESEGQGGGGGGAGGTQQQQRLACFGTSRDTAECSWTWPTIFEQKNNPLIGFRTVLSSTQTGVPWNVTIVGPEQRRAHLMGLNPKAVYRFRLQAVTAHGLGAELVEHFGTGHLAPKANSTAQTELAIHVGGDNFPEIVELPWGSSASAPSFPFPSSPFLLLLLLPLCIIFI